MSEAAERKDCPTGGCPYGVRSMEKYVCSVCGYVYDPAVGVPEEGIAPGTPFYQLPEGFLCPICGVEKNLFEKQA